MTTPHAYRIVRVADPRSRGACSWYEIEGIAADGSRWHVATVDDRREARELVRQIEADDARRAAQAADDAAIVLDACPPAEARISLADVLLADAANEARQALAAARAAAGRVNDRRLAAGRLPAKAVAELRRYSPSLVADRTAIAAAIRAARAAVKNFCSPS